MGTWCKTPVDAMHIHDDRCSQCAMLIKPDAWLRIFKPVYKEFCDMTHDYGKYALMHSDGWMNHGHHSEPDRDRCEYVYNSSAYRSRNCLKSFIIRSASTSGRNTVFFEKTWQACPLQCNEFATESVQICIV